MPSGLQSVASTSIQVHLPTRETRMTDGTAWYVTERAEQLAIMLLTRIANLRVSREVREEGLDLLVTIESGNLTERRFGIEVKATKNIRSLVNSNGIVKRDVALRLGQRARAHSFPVGVLIVDVVSDMARFGWILKPDSTGPTFTGNIHTDVATNEFMRRALEEVTRWYDRGAVSN
jgi:Domain of unknown function (DUF4365)